MPKIGKKLRSLRQRRHLSTRELAERSGVSHSTISLIERDKISPTIDTLSGILEAMGSSMVGFLARPREAADTSFYSGDELPEIGNAETISYKIIGLNYPFRSIQFLKETYAPLADTGKLISHTAQETGIVLSGEVEVTVDKEVRVLGAGDAYYFDSRLEHRFKNIGGTKAEIVSAVSPPSF